MIVITYQSVQVLKTLHRGEIYRAKPSISFKGEYAALIDMLGLKCNCPVFGVVKGKKQNTGGKVSGSVKLILDIPDKYIKLTEFSVWADFLEAYKYTKKGNYKKIILESTEMTQKRYDGIMTELKEQKKLADYIYPQVILEKINPVWLKSYKYIIGNSGGFAGKIKSLFAK